MAPILVPVSKLDFDLHNPRYPSQEGQRVAWEKILFSMPEKSLRLAQHICLHGQNPIDIIAVIPSGTRYIVLEGNRRASVLRALNKPMMLEDAPATPTLPTFAKQMRKLAKDTPASRIKQVYVVIFESRDDAEPWIQLKHTGENDGAGTVPWDSTQAARFRNESDVGLQLLDYGKASGWFTDDQLTVNGPFPISTLNRLLGDPAVRALMGVESTKGQLISNVESAELAKTVKQIVNDLTVGGWNVSKLKNKADRQNYISQFPDISKPALPALPTNWLVDSDVASSKPAQPAARPRVQSQAKIRKTLIPRQFVITTSDTSPRLEKIYLELKKLTVEANKNAVAVLLRTFIELSLDDLIARSDVTVTKAKYQATLAEKAKSAAAHFKQLGQLDKNQEAIVKRLVGDGVDPQSQAASITTLHSFVHSRHASPVASELLDIWDNIAPFVKLIAHV